MLEISQDELESWNWEGVEVGMMRLRRRIMKVIEMMTRRMRRWRSILKVMKEEVEEYPEGGEDPLPADLAVSPALLRPEQERQPCNI